MTPRTFKVSTTLAFSLGLLAASPALAAPKCAEVQLIDKTGTAVKSHGSVIGALVGGRPIIDQQLANGVTLQPRGESTCPYKLITDIAATFKKACTTDKERNKAASDFKKDRKIIDEECTDLQGFLSSQ